MSVTGETGRTRIAYFIYHTGLGGGELLLVNHLAHADREKFDPLVICTGEGPLAARLREIGVPVFIIPMYRRTAILGRMWVPSVACVAQLVALLKRERVDLIHSYTLDTRNYANAAAVMSGIPVIHSCHDTWHGQTFGAAQWWVMNHVPVRIIAVSETARTSLRTGVKLDPRRVTVIPGAIDLARFSGDSNRLAVRAEFGLDDDTPLVGFVGRLDVPVKGFDTLAEAVALLVKRLPSARVMVVGGAVLPGDDVGEAMRLIDRYDLASRMIMTGHRDDVPRLLAAMDVVVSASPRECYPLVLMEAAAAGKAVVATRSGGGEEIVVDGITGVLVPVRDPRAMAEALFDLLTDRGKAGEMGRAARERAQACFDIRRMVKQVESEYLAGLSPRGRYAHSER